MKNDKILQINGVLMIIYNFKHQNDRFVEIVLFWFIQGLTSTGCTVI